MGLLMAQRKLKNLQQSKGKKEDGINCKKIGYIVVRKTNFSGCVRKRIRYFKIKEAEKFNSVLTRI